MKNLIVQIVCLLIVVNCSYGQKNTEHRLNEIMSNSFSYHMNEVDQQTVDNRNIFVRDSIVEFVGEDLTRFKRWHYVNNDDLDWWIEAISNVVNGNYNIILTNVRTFNPDSSVKGKRTLIGSLFNGEPFQDKDYTYNEDGSYHEILTTRHEASDSSWNNFKKQTFTYDGFLGDTSITFEWDPIGEIWVQQSGIIYIKRNEEFFPGILFSFTNDDLAQEIEYTWIENSNIPKTITLKQGVTLDLAEPVLQVSYTYENNLNTERVVSIFNPDINDWELDSKVELDYLADEYLEVEEFYSRENDTWVFTGKKNHYYSEVVVPTFEISDNRINLIHANPIRNGTPIQINGLKINETITFSLHDIQGRLVLEEVIHSDTQIHLPDYMPSGPYFLQLNSEDGLLVAEKLIKI